jgi:SAM-dependent methyltransferase
VRYRPVSAEETLRANRADWDRCADDYQSEHGAFLRDSGFIWSPEGLDEGTAHLLGEIRGKAILEVGCGAGQCSRWLVGQGALAIGLDVSIRQLHHSARLDDTTGVRVQVVCATATDLPFASASFDHAFSAFGALPFVADVEPVMREVARVVRPGGQWVFAVSHPMKWTLPDDPTEAGLTIVRSYFDRTPYVEEDDHGNPTYVEHHRTIGDWIRALVGCGFDLVDLIEPPWPDDLDRVWAGWGPIRGRLIPGTAIFSCRRRGPSERVTQRHSPGRNPSADLYSPGGSMSSSCSSWSSK